MKKYKCRLCGSKNVQELKWVNANNQQISQLEENDLNVIGTWEKCKDCYSGQQMSIKLKWHIGPDYPLIIEAERNLDQ
ncbi:MAG: hypothetical protein Unbinned400contig1004_30 [Prokaryotic dsDNA virus sp.]|nr:MAG: hypothetical protein Unbinned400contig1004_30 [Prokaryotic dsDNA virus sp.]|tara:strand:+ start:181 stop:414 length:234 start_codon:yes stop_codon:yes gene_type:complete